MKLASLRSGRDGELAVVSRDLSRILPVPDVAPTLQAALDRWDEVSPALHAAFEVLNADEAPSARRLEPEALAAPLPRAYQWLDGSSYLNHVQLVRRSRGVEMPPEFWKDPLMYQGGSDVFLGPRDAILASSEEWGIDFEAEVVVIVDDVPMGASAELCRHAIRLIALVNDVSLRNLIPAELAKGIGFVHGKPPTAFSPVVATPDELGTAWRDGRVHLPLRVERNDEVFGYPNAGEGMVFDFPALIAHAARTRPLGAGTVIGSGTVSNEDRTVGSCCIVERRTLEILEDGKPTTPFLSFGERIRVEMLDEAGASIFGAIDQRVVHAGSTRV